MADVRVYEELPRWKRVLFFAAAPFTVHIDFVNGRWMCFYRWRSGPHYEVTHGA